MAGAKLQGDAKMWVRAWLCVMLVVLAVPGPGVGQSSQDGGASENGSTQQTQETSGIELKVAPTPNETYIITNVVQSNTVLQAGKNNELRLVDVLTNIVDLQTGYQEFGGDVSVTTRLRSSEASAMSGMMQPLPRESPLKKLVGASGTYAIHDGSRMRRVSQDFPKAIPRGGPEMFDELVAGALAPVQFPQRALSVGEAFVSNRERSMPIGGRKVRIRTRETYQITGVDGNRILIRMQSRVKPVGKHRDMKLSGGGHGKFVYRTDMGLLRSVVKNLALRGMFRRQGQKVKFQFNTQTDIVVQTPEELAQTNGGSR